MTLSPEEANQQYKRTVNDLIAKHGLWRNIPKEELREASETLRLHHTIHANSGQVSRDLLSKNMFSEAIIAKVNPSFDGFQPKVKRSAKYNSAYDWLAQNVGKTFTTQDISDALEMSYPTTLKFIENNPNHFRKVKRGEYQVRDPKADREAEK